MIGKMACSIAPFQKIGLLGGSFNPAHEGHLHLSLQALKRLRLDRVIWLVSPQNPLKSRAGMAAYETRLAGAQALTAPHPQLFASALEAEIGSHYSIDTLRYLCGRYPQSRFVWLMGADNLQQMHHWYCWREILQQMPVAIFDRAPFSHAALRSPAALTYYKQRCPEGLLLQLAQMQPPAWAYVFMPRHPESATRLRKTLGKEAFLVHT